VPGALANVGGGIETATESLRLLLKRKCKILIDP
jgi:hypothetical protein